MLEVLRQIDSLKQEGTALDQEVIDGKTGIVARNLSQIEGRTRSCKYIRRLAGESTDTTRRSRTQAIVEWFGATAAENPQNRLKFQAFFTALFSITSPMPVHSVGLWETGEEVNAHLSDLRTAILKGDKIQARYSVAAIQQKAQVMQLLIDSDVQSQFNVKTVGR